MKFRHNNGWIGLQLACVTASLLSLAGCNSSVASGGGSMPVPEVMVADVQERDVRSWDEFNGRLSAIDSVAVRPRVSGYIEQMAFKEGDEVKKGDLLFLIDQRQYQAEVNSASALCTSALAWARAALRLSNSSREMALAPISV